MLPNYLLYEFLRFSTKIKLNINLLHLAHTYKLENKEKIFLTLNLNRHIQNNAVTNPFLPKRD